MTELDADIGAPRSRLVLLVSNWWPVPAFIAVGLVAQQLVIGSRYDVGGHAAEHLTGVSVPFMAAAVASVVFWATPLARRQVDVVVATCLWFAMTVLVSIGNLRVVDDLVAAGYSRTPTSSVPDVADHSLANASIWYAFAAALLVVAAWHRRRHIGNRATIGAVLATVVIPPWIIPGAGVVVLAIVCLVQRGRTLKVVPVLEVLARVS